MFFDRTTAILEILMKTQSVICKVWLLSGILAKSGPLDFATKNSFPLFFVSEKGLVHVYQNHFIYFPILYFCFATRQKPILPAPGFQRWSRDWNVWILRGVLRPIKCSLRNFTLTYHLRQIDQAHRQNVEKVDKFLSTSGKVKDNLLWSL